MMQFHILSIPSMILFLACMTIAAEQKWDTLFIARTDTVVVCTTWHAPGKIQSVDRWISMPVNGTRELVYDGTQQEWYVSGRVKCTAAFVFGCILDTVKRFHPNGKRQSVEPYLSCKKNGECNTWDSTGFLLQTGAFINGVPVGTHREWFAPKKPKLVTVYNDQGRKHGMQVRWNIADVVLDSFVWEKGEIVSAKIFYENGKLLIHDLRRTTMKRFDAIFYDPNGKESGRTVDGNGTVECYAKNGKKHWPETYLNGIVQNEEPPDE